MYPIDRRKIAIHVYNIFKSLTVSGTVKWNMMIPWSFHEYVKYVLTVKYTTTTTNSNYIQSIPT